MRSNLHVQSIHREYFTWLNEARRQHVTTHPYIYSNGFIHIHASFFLRVGQRVLVRDDERYAGGAIRVTKSARGHRQVARDFKASPYLAVRAKEDLGRPGRFSMSSLRPSSALS